jgi:hypothetical protein
MAPEILLSFSQNVHSLIGKTKKCVEYKLRGKLRSKRNTI